jgi:hypothetical protein
VFGLLSELPYIFCILGIRGGPHENPFMILDQTNLPIKDEDRLNWLELVQIIPVENLLVKALGFITLHYVKSPKMRWSARRIVQN